MGANARLQLHLENFLSKRGITVSKKIEDSPTGMGSPFDNEQLF